MVNKTVNRNHFPWSQVIGFLLSIALTFIAVWIGIRSDLTYRTIVILVFSLAFIQAAIQLFMFMHVSEGEHGIWQIGKMISAAFIAIVIVVGSIWVLNQMH
ncbi:cytochrome aa3 quinol oxidase subunit IV [Paenibacillus sp. FSL A5-0031]|uniref:cytochrome aa3 quinol oxidase subunit IV n=1 Tax=Paenibacillus sp. FSL A5-0031 TaxID=1920420 RepID=UPI00096E5291|nr:cytochrome aa3 quinol oxidase subunit IV [Paenibacillus sp. FSL A5-0031]OME75950.1 cytochrome aa3 quinol oxidase subunit IV [Paenibacillus sp. FSL A5-0031]